MIMNKWQCEICGKGFDNFQAQGFDNKIYCPLCYYKKLYQDTELERERLNNIINGALKYIETNILDKKIDEVDWDYDDCYYSDMPAERIKPLVDKLKEGK